MTEPVALLRQGFNPRLPGGRRPLGYYSVSDCKRFQSTPSGGKATRVLRRCKCCVMFQSTPSGGKATRSRLETCTLPWFQSTPSGGKATRRPARLPSNRVVSIHAFRGEGDMSHHQCNYRSMCFNPRLPGGRRLMRRCVQSSSATFQSTPSGGKATYS